MDGLIITGTDTGVGKTHIAASIVRSCVERRMRVGAYKPVCTGVDAQGSGEASPWADVRVLHSALGGEVPMDDICPQRFDAPLAPPAAARLEGRSVDAALLRSGLERWRARADLLIVEGVGGLLCPLTETSTIADFASGLGYPLIIVVEIRLGAINHTLLTVEVARQRGLPVAGLILNETSPPDDSRDSTVDEIALRCKVPILCHVAHDPHHELRLPDSIRKMEWRQLAAPGLIS